MTKSRAIPLAARVKAAVERAEKAEGQIAALDYGLKAAHHQARCLKGELTKLQEAQKAAKARIKELEGPQTVPPPDKPECLLYGKAATMKTVFDLYETEAAARKAVQCELGAKAAKLADVEKALSYSNRRGDIYMRMYNTACRDRTNDRIAHEAAKFKAGTVVTVPSLQPFWPSVALYSGLSGMALGALVGGLLL